uniref:Endonuclease/exonuclease/phosphatase domain-containing protein n=1 Tax=Biomphalaria glabrata TaxID=6526 RepID=A0A2C9KQ66_BIOGL
MRQTAIIDRELSRLNIDVACLQETRLADSGSLTESNYTFYWQGQPEQSPRIHGVGFAIRNSLVPCIAMFPIGNERVAHMKFASPQGKANIICAYSPTLAAPEEDKDRFFQALDDVIKSIPKSEHLYINGDFNAGVGDGNDAWPKCLGPHGVGKINDNGKRLLEFCSSHELCVTNTFFSGKECHKVSWQHPRSKRWHQPDLCITRRMDLKSVIHTRSYHSADCNSDHSLVLSKIKLLLKKAYTSTQPRTRRINVNHVGDPEKCALFASS